MGKLILNTSRSGPSQGGDSDGAGQGTKVPRKGRLRVWLRFSLRGMFIAVAILCVYLAWLQNRVHREYVAVRELALRGYWLHYSDINEQFKGVRPSRMEATGNLLHFWRNGFVQEWEYFGLVDSAWSPYDSKTDDVALFVDITGLKGVVLRGPAITDQELQELIAPRSIEVISLKGCALTKGSVSMLKQHDELRVLDFRDVSAIPYKEREQYELMMALPNCDVTGGWPELDDVTKRRIESFRARRAARD